MPQNSFDDKSTLVQVLAWCLQAASHYLNQCWSRVMSPDGVAGPKCVNDWYSICKLLIFWCFICHFSWREGGVGVFLLKFPSLIRRNQVHRHTLRPKRNDQHVVDIVQCTHAYCCTVYWRYTATYLYHWWDFEQNTIIFIEENVFENICGEVLGIV